MNGASDFLIFKHSVVLHELKLSRRRRDLFDGYVLLPYDYRAIF